MYSFEKRRREVSDELPLYREEEADVERELRELRRSNDTLLGRVRRLRQLDETPPEKGLREASPWREASFFPYEERYRSMVERGEDEEERDIKESLRLRRLQSLIVKLFVDRAAAIERSKLDRLNACEHLREALVRATFQQWKNRKHSVVEELENVKKRQTELQRELASAASALAASAKAATCDRGRAKTLERNRESEMSKRLSAEASLKSAVDELAHERARSDDLSSQADAAKQEATALKAALEKAQEINNQRRCATYLRETRIALGGDDDEDNEDVVFFKDETEDDAQMRREATLLQRKVQRLLEVAASKNTLKNDAFASDLKDIVRDTQQKLAKTLANATDDARTLSTTVLNRIIDSIESDNLPPPSRKAPWEKIMPTISLVEDFAFQKAANQLILLERRDATLRQKNDTLRRSVATKIIRRALSNKAQRTLGRSFCHWIDTTAPQRRTSTFRLYCSGLLIAFFLTAATVTRIEDLINGDPAPFVTFYIAQNIVALSSSLLVDTQQRTACAIAASFYALTVIIPIVALFLLDSAPTARFD